LVLVILIVVWALTPSHGRVPGGFPIFVLFALPLLLPLRGMWQENAKAFVSAALIALVYLLHALVTLTSSSDEYLFGWLEMLLSLLLLITASLHARWLAHRS
jgi:uncharacterized membrane protein